MHMRDAELETSSARRGRLPFTGLSRCRSSRYQDAVAPPVAIIVLNWNKPQLTIRCIESIHRLDYPSIRLYVVDNGSEDASPDLLRCAIAANPGIETNLICNPSNLGYAGGNNIAIRQALKDGAAYVWVVNNDAEPATDSLRHLVSRAEANPRLGLISPLLYRPSDQGGGIECAGVQIDPSSADYKFTTDLDTARKWQTESPEKVGAVGTAVLLRNHMLDQVGLFDDGLFAYFEDFDLSIRATRAGFLCETVFSSTVYHRERPGNASDHHIKSPHVYYYNIRNEIVLSRRYGTTLAGLRRTWWNLVKRLALIRRLHQSGRHQPVIEALLAGLWDGWLGRGGCYNARRRAPWACRTALLALARTAKVRP